MPKGTGRASTLVAAAIERIPEQTRDMAEEVIHLHAGGWGPVEIGKRVGISGRAVNELRRQIGDQLVKVLVEQEGYTPAEAIRTLRVPSDVVIAAMAEEQGLGRRRPAAPRQGRNSP